MTAPAQAYAYKVYNMSDTPQNDETINEVVNEVVETNDSVPSSENGEQVQAGSNEQVDEVEVAKQKANEAFNKQYGEKKQLERDLETERQKTADFEAKERERQQALVQDIPPIPDYLDDDFDEKMKERDAKIAAQSNFNAQQEAFTQQQQFHQQQAAQAVQIEQAKTLQEHKGRADSLGIKPEEMIAAETAVVNYGYTPELLTHLAGDKESPLLIKHLAANPQDGYQLANLAATNPYGVSVFLEQVREKAGALKPKTSNTPEPSTELKGGSTDLDANKDPNLEGVQYT